MHSLQFIFGLSAKGRPIQEWQAGSRVRSAGWLGFSLDKRKVRCTHITSHSKSSKALMFTDLTVGKQDQSAAAGLTHGKKTH